MDQGGFGFKFNKEILEVKSYMIGTRIPEETEFSDPVLFINGGASSYVKEQDVLDIKLHFPNAILKTIEGTGHWLHAEKPEEFSQLVAEFLK